MVLLYMTIMTWGTNHVNTGDNRVYPRLLCANRVAEVLLSQVKSKKGIQC